MPQAQWLSVVVRDGRVAPALPSCWGSGWTVLGIFPIPPKTPSPSSPWLSDLPELWAWLMHISHISHISRQPQQAQIQGLFWPLLPVCLKTPLPSLWIRFTAGASSRLESLSSHLCVPSSVCVPLGVSVTFWVCQSVQLFLYM